MSYAVARSLIGEQPIVTLQDDAGRRVRVACHGGALISFEVPREGRSFDIAAGRRDAAEINAHPGSRFALMAPFASRIRTRLSDPKTRTALAVWQEHGVMHVFTGDTLKRDARRSVALEPMECMAGAFNRPEWAHALRLEPGAERVYRCGVETTG